MFCGVDCEFPCCNRFSDRLFDSSLISYYIKMENCGKTVHRKSTNKAAVVVDKPLCPVCVKQFKQKKHLYEHMRNVHKEETQDISTSKNLKCPVCSKSENSRQKIYAHLHETHDITVNNERKTFSDMNEFNRWKEDIERDTRSQYVLKRGIKRLADESKKLYYHCSRSGDYEREKCMKSRKKQHSVSTENVKRRRIKSQGTKRIGKFCPAAIEVKIFPDDLIEVSFWSTHIGHTLDLEHCNLSKMERAAIIGKLSQGVTLNRILDDVRDSVSTDEKISRVHLLTKKDLNNLLNQLPSNIKCKQHQNDAISISIWEKQNPLNEDIDNLFQCAVNQTILKGHSTLQNEIKEKTEQILGLCSKSNFDDATCQSVIKHLDRARELLTVPSEVPSCSKECSLEPVNKKVIQQQRYFSTKKKIKRPDALNRSKPSSSEKATIIKCLKDQECINIHTGNDHTYL